MGRLIDADVLLDDMKKELEKAVNNEDMTEFDCKVLMTSALALKNFVNRQPTVFDKDKVIDEFVAKFTVRTLDEIHPQYVGSVMILIAEIAEQMKAGGIDG